MNYTTTTSLAIVIILAAVALIVIIPGYLQDAKAATKTHSKSLSMSTSCNGPDEPCQTTVCEDNKPCRNLDPNSSSQPQQTENTTAAAQPQQQPDSSSDTTPFHKHHLFHKYRNDTFPQIPPTPQIPDYSDDEDEFD
jgi:FtsZ-interacting cell division protein ZipA